MSKLQLIEISETELAQKIVNSITPIIDELKTHFEPKTPTEYLTREEVATLLKVNLVTVWSYTRKGILKSYKVTNNRVLYKRAEVEAALKEIKH